MIQWIYGRNSILSRNYERIIYQGVSLPIQFEKLSPKTIKCAWKIGENKLKKKIIQGQFSLDKSGELIEK